MKGKVSFDSYIIWKENSLLPAWKLQFLRKYISTDYVKRYATEEALKEQEAAQADSSDSESSMSDFSEDEAQDMEL